MLKFMTNRILYSVLLAPMVTASAAPADLSEARARLQALADVLKWQGAMNATYPPVVEKVTPALEAVSRIAESSPDTQATVALQRLKRLYIESKYFADESSDPAYQPNPLESDEYLTANVDEWRYAVKVYSDRLDKPVCDILSNLPAPQSQSIPADAEPGTEFQDNDLTPTMVVIPTGTYTSGASPSEHAKWRVPADKQDFERPQRQVTISKHLAFSRTEVTLGQFKAFIARTCYQPRLGARWWDPNNVENFGFNETVNYLNTGFPQTDDHPVVAVTRDDAQAYAQWLSGITGQSYRLPNEDEWEWAARGGGQSTFFWGENLTDAYMYANTYDNAAAAANHFRWPSNNMTDGFPYTAPVASFLPNGYGLYDVTANAREFMADDWITNLSTTTNDGSTHKGPAPFPVVRGGAWNYNPRNLRINYRSAYFSSEISTNMFGIRLVRDL